ncbi:MAG: hypothetical protein AB7E81_13685 [Hyphomicrobiaceae bacterium]
MFDRWQPMLDEAILEWKKKGIEVKTPPAEEIAKMNTGPHAQAVFDAWNARAKQLGLDPEAFLKDVRTVLAQ